jgi:hypothetical protein
MYQDAISFSLDALWCYNDRLNNRAYAVGVFAFGRAILSSFLFSVFALGERKNGKQMKRSSLFSPRQSRAVLLQIRCSVSRAAREKRSTKEDEVPCCRRQNGVGEHNRMQRIANRS